jgi:hypothetical protein
MFFGIRTTSREPDGSSVFRTFSEARRSVVRDLQRRAAEYQRSAREAARMTRADVEDGDGY